MSSFGFWIVGSFGFWIVGFASRLHASFPSIFTSPPFASFASFASFGSVRVVGCCPGSMALAALSTASAASAPAPERRLERPQVEPRVGDSPVPRPRLDRRLGVPDEVRRELDDRGHAHHHPSSASWYSLALVKICRTSAIRLRAGSPRRAAVFATVPRSILRETKFP